MAFGFCCCFFRFCETFFNFLSISILGDSPNKCSHVQGEKEIPRDQWKKEVLNFKQSQNGIIYKNGSLILLLRHTTPKIKKVNE